MVLCDDDESEKQQGKDKSERVVVMGFVMGSLNVSSTGRERVTKRACVKVMNRAQVKSEGECL